MTLVARYRRTLVIAASVAAAMPHAASAAAPCSNDAFVVDGTPLTVAVCAGQPAAGRVALVETFTVRGAAPLQRTVDAGAPAGAEAIRTIDDAPLAKLGIAKTLHMTISYKSGAVRLEHALLVPGAVPLK